MATPSNPKGEPRKAHSKKLMFERAFKDQALTLDDLSPYRVRAAWRAVRWICTKLGVLDGDMLLGSLPEEARDGTQGLDLFYRPWTSDQFSPPQPDRPTRRLMEIVRRCEDHADEVPYSKLADATDAIVTGRKRGFTLLPTSETAEHWVEALNLAAEYLFIARGSVTDKDQGRYGLMGLNKPETAAVACPMMVEMLFWELHLVDEAVKLYASTGEHLIDGKMREHYGLLPGETKPIMAQARRVIRETTDFDVEERRALMVMQINDVISRAQESLDPRAELAALKLRSQIEGITRVEPDDMAKMFRKIVSETTRERRQIDYTRENVIEEPA